MSAVRPQASEIRCIEVTLSIPDNEARTAQRTLERLGVAVARLRRADIYCFELAEGARIDVLAAARDLETIYNQSKQTLRARPAEPREGEVWIDEGRVTEASGATLRLSGRTLPGVRRMTRYLSWSLADERGDPASPNVVDRALETLLCNPAFQKARR